MNAWSLGSYIFYVLLSLFLLLVVLWRLYGEKPNIWTLQSCPVDLTGKVAVVTGANSGSYIFYVLLSLFLLLVVLWRLYGEKPNIWTLQSCPVDLTGKITVVTGDNSSLGKAVSCELARRGARVVLACRRLPQGQKALEDIQKATGSKELLLRELDLSSVASIQSFSQKLLQEEPRIHLLVNNAGISVPYKTLTPDGLELTFMTNYLGHFLLTNLLLRGLIQAGSARVVNVTSFRHKYGFVDEQHLVGAGRPVPVNKQYDCSKLLLIIFTQELARRLQGKGVTVNSVEPGIVNTEIMKNHSWWLRYIFKLLSVFFKGSIPILYLSLAEELDDISGKYFNSNCNLVLPAESARDPDVAYSLWKTSARLTNLEKMTKKE